jgi:phosphoglucomutase
MTWSAGEYMITGDRFGSWLNDGAIDQKTKDIMLSMPEDEKNDAFYKDLEFGTGGIRGIMGVGPNRMNIYVVRRVTYALGRLISLGDIREKERGVVIAFDVRHHSKEFALEASLVLCGMGIKVFLYDDIRTTPQLSFSVLRLGAKAGVMVTASHNPKEYNGYKAYWDDGAQILPDLAQKIEEIAGTVDSFSDISGMDEKEARRSGLLVSPDKKLDDEYTEKVKSLSLSDDIDKEIPVIYTPLNGTADIPVRRVLHERGFKCISVVEEQSMPDPDFTTAPFPNPEDKRAFEYAIRLGIEKNASILVANDPDGDRTALMVRDGDRYVYLNGNQTGALLIKYMIDAYLIKGKLPENAMVIKTIVTNDLGGKVAQDHGVAVFDTLTGFKNICGTAIEKEKNGYKLLLGYEESIGYNAGTFVRDKDGVSAVMLICEAAAFYGKRSLSLYDILQKLSVRYGYHTDNNFSVTLEGREGNERIMRIMECFRKKGVTSLAGNKITAVTDYLYQTKRDLTGGSMPVADIPQADVLRFDAGIGLWFCIRPSGTEPKIKIYIYGNADTYETATDLVASAGKELRSFIADIA